MPGTVFIRSEAAEATAVAASEEISGAETSVADTTTEATAEAAETTVSVFFVTTIHVSANVSANLLGGATMVVEEIVNV